MTRLTLVAATLAALVLKKRTASRSTLRLAVLF